ncbi:unnamed protein product [Brassicogethes aeneus]|uniref:Regulatory protein zeste n=1 Tax=Brassicogethes aeneus TaxID=1431903 RepID=A0A9P0AZV5_BRAAE|nr:unnamed protein product [Brassicogethes aeneus]
MRKRTLDGVRYPYLYLIHEEIKKLYDNDAGNKSNEMKWDVLTLRRKYENIKKRTKKKYADEKVYARGTGGGPSKMSKFSSLEESVKDILGTRITGSQSNYDDDSTVNICSENKKIPAFETETHEINYDDENIEKESEKIQVLEEPETLGDWRTYEPSMLKQSSTLVPRWRTSSNATPLSEEDKENNFQNILNETEISTPRKATPKQKITPKQKANDIWTQVGKAKLDILHLQKENLLEDHQRKNARDEEEHLLKLEILRAELDAKRKICNACKNLV